VYISVTTLHTLYLQQFSVVINVQTFQHLKITDQQTFTKTTQVLNAVLHMETIRTPRLHKSKDFRNLLGTTGIAMNM